MAAIRILKINHVPVLADEILDETMWALAHEAARREGRACTAGYYLVDLSSHPDLEKIRWEAFDAAAERLRQRPALRVKVGDFVRINGYRFRIHDVDPLACVVCTARVDVEGHVISCVSCDGAGLVPETEEERALPDGNDDLDPRLWLHGGGDRARFVLNSHKRALGARLID